jgi:hypothetical protein
MRTAVSSVCVFCINTPKSIIPHANGTNINATIAISTAIAPCSLTCCFAREIPATRPVANSEMD